MLTVKRISGGDDLALLVRQINDAEWDDANQVAAYAVENGVPTLLGHRVHRVDSGEDLAQLLRRYVYLYNHHIPRKALDNQPLIKALKMWQKKKPKLFMKRVVSPRGSDI